MPKRRPRAGQPPADDGPRCSPAEAVIFGRNFKAARRKLKLSQQAVEKLTGIPQPYISTLESGQENPTIETMGKLARAVTTSVQALLKP